MNKKLVFYNQFIVVKDSIISGRLIVKNPSPFIFYADTKSGKIERVGERDVFVAIFAIYYIKSATLVKGSWGDTDYL